LHVLIADIVVGSDLTLAAKAAAATAAVRSLEPFIQ
jgi:hypothetical protein